MVASQAIGATVVVLPFWHTFRKAYVARGADLDAFSTADAHIRGHMKLFVGDHFGIEVGTDYVAESPWKGALLDKKSSSFPAANDIDGCVNVFRCLCYFFFFSLWLVGVHERQTYV